MTNTENTPEMIRTRTYARAAALAALADGMAADGARLISAGRTADAQVLIGQALEMWTTSDAMRAAAAL